MRIMILEDDALLATILGELLAAMGHEVCAIEATEAGATAAAARLRPELILADVQLAQGDGLAAMTAITRTQATPHIYITGAAAKAEGLPPDAIVLLKPFSDRLLETAITRAKAPRRHDPEQIPRAPAPDAMP